MFYECVRDGDWRESVSDAKYSVVTFGRWSIVSIIYKEIRIRSVQGGKGKGEREKE